MVEANFESKTILRVAVGLWVLFANFKGSKKCKK